MNDQREERVATASSASPFGAPSATGAPTPSPPPRGASPLAIVGIVFTCFFVAIIARVTADSGGLGTAAALILGVASIAFAVVVKPPKFIRNTAVVAGALVLFVSVLSMLQRGPKDRAAADCRDAMTKLSTLKGGDMSYAEAIAEFDRGIAIAEAGIPRCDAARMTDTAEGLRKTKRDFEGQRYAGMKRAREAATTTAANAPDSGRTLDPTSCPKGQVLYNMAGEHINCTGGGPATWLAALGTLTKDPKGSNPIAVDKNDPAEVDYSFNLNPFTLTKVTLLDRVPGRWMLALKSSADHVRELSATGQPKHLCDKGDSSWYAIADGDGPLGGSFAASGKPDRQGVVDTVVWSKSAMQAGKARDEANGASRTSSIEESICGGTQDTVDPVRGPSPKDRWLDGCNYICRKAVIADLNDNDSFECVSSTEPQVEGAYWTTVMSYRAKNGLGAKVLDQTKCFIQGGSVVKMK